MEPEVEGEAGRSEWKSISKEELVTLEAAGYWASRKVKGQTWP